MPKARPTTYKPRKEKSLTKRASILADESKAATRDKIDGARTLYLIEQNYLEVEVIQSEVLEITGPIENPKFQKSKVVLLVQPPKLSVKDQVDKLKLRLDCIKVKLDVNWKKLNKLLPDAKIEEQEGKKSRAVDFIEAMHSAMDRTNAAG